MTYFKSGLVWHLLPWFRLASNLQQCSCLIFPSAGITDVNHYTRKVFFFYCSILTPLWLFLPPPPPILAQGRYRGERTQLSWQLSTLPGPEGGERGQCISVVKRRRCVPSAAFLAPHRVQNYVWCCLSSHTTLFKKLHL